MNWKGPNSYGRNITALMTVIRYSIWPKHSCFLPGEIGKLGNPGCKGQIGPDGPKGESGDPGDIGLAGFQGTEYNIRFWCI